MAPKKTTTKTITEKTGISKAALVASNEASDERATLTTENANTKQPTEDELPALEVALEPQAGRGETPEGHASEEPSENAVDDDITKQVRNLKKLDDYHNEIQMLQQQKDYLL